MKISGYAENEVWTEGRMSQSGQLKVDLLPPDCEQDLESALISVATGDQVKLVTLSGQSGKTKAIKRVYLYVPGAGEACKYKVGRGTVGSPSYLHTDNIYYACSPFVVFESFNPALFLDSNVVLAINTGSAGTENVYVVVEYYYKP